MPGRPRTHPGAGGLKGDAGGTPELVLFYTFTVCMRSPMLRGRARAGGRQRPRRRHTVFAVPERSPADRSPEPYACPCSPAPPPPHSPSRNGAVRHFHSLGREGCCRADPVRPPSGQPPRLPSRSTPRISGTISTPHPMATGHLARGPGRGTARRAEAGLTPREGTDVRCFPRGASARGRQFHSPLFRSAERNRTAKESRETGRRPSRGPCRSSAMSLLSRDPVVNPGRVCGNPARRQD